MTPKTAITVGNFDGVHVGHRALVNRARELAGPGGRVVVLAFDPHPVTVLRPEIEPPARLSTFDERTRLLTEFGASEVVRLKPTPDLLELSPAEFVKMLINRFHMDTIVEGPDFRFGQGRAGNIDTLRALGDEGSFEVLEVAPINVVLSDDLVVTASSTTTRWLLRHGRVADVARMLDRPYAVTSTVRKGDQRGRKIGFPTANLLPDCALPAPGVYAGRAEIVDKRLRSSGQTYPAAINVGIRPTFHTVSDTVCEVHLIGYDGETSQYDWTIRVEFLVFLRDEMRFAGVDELARQIRRDIAAARMLLADRARRRESEPATMVS